MRELLAPLLGQRHRFRATVSRLGGGGGGDTKLLLIDVADAATGMVYCDHVWVHYDDALRGLPFGRRITCTAVVRRYRRHGNGHDYGLCALQGDITGEQR